MKFNIRGGLGFQLLGLIGAHAQAIEHSDHVKEITLHFGNYPEGIHEANIDFLSKIVIPDFQIKEDWGPVQKFKFFTPENIRLVHKHIEEIHRRIKIRDNDTCGAEVALHVRQRDRPLVTLKSYNKIVDYYSKYLTQITVYSDDYSSQSFLAKTSPYDNTVSDWFSINRSLNIIGGVSSFTIASAILNPVQRLRIIKREFCTQGLLTETDWQSIDTLILLFDNIDWENEVPLA